MDEQRIRRGLLLADKEDIERDIESTKRRLAELGDDLMRLGEALKSQPDRVTFKGVPSGVENRVPDLLLGQPAFQWSQVDPHSALQLTMRLRDLKMRLQSLTAELANDIVAIRVAQ